MTAEALETVVENDAFPEAAPALSVLIPFLCDDPRPLLTALEREAAKLAGRVEVILLDDGTNNPELASAVARVVKHSRLPARCVLLVKNEGRAKGRNRLAAHARSGSLLFLDSDMQPDHKNFLRVWLDLAEQERPAVAFGGFSRRARVPVRHRARPPP
jgi:hypothetical protein